MENLDRSLDEIMGSRKSGPSRKRDRKAKSSRSSPYARPIKSGSSSARVYVGNLDWKVSWQDLKDHMRSAGTVVRADVMSLPDGKSKGCGIVEFSSANEASRAIKDLTDTELNGRPIFVREDREAAGSTGRTTSSRTTSRAPSRGGDFKKPVFSSESALATRIRNEAAPGCQVRISNIPWSCSWQDIKDLSTKYGPVVRADVPADGKERSRGFGLVVFEEPAAAERCIRDLDGCLYEDRELTVSLIGGGKARGARATEGRARATEGRACFTCGGTGHIAAVCPSPSTRGGSGRDSGRSSSSRGSGSTIYIGNLDWSVSWQNLKDLCREFGNVSHADVPQDQQGRSKGFGLATFADLRDANAAIRGLNGSEYQGRELFVRYDKM